MEIGNSSKDIDVIYELPGDSSLDVQALGRLFGSTTNSYKYVFFQALLRLIKQAEAKGQSKLRFSYKEIVVEMLALTWYPHRYFRLSFGVQDQIAKILDKLEFIADGQAVTNHDFQSLLKKSISEQYELIGAAQLMDYVPTRLLTPFFADHLKGLRDCVKDKTILNYAVSSFESASPPLYRLSDSHGLEIVEIHPEWYKYIVCNMVVTTGWANFEWVKYLQNRNPSAPAIVHKIAAPENRGSLAKQKEYWRLVIDCSPEPFRCIYSNTVLTPDKFSLDHFLPWSFVCHDQLWNLVPADASANSSKGKLLPNSGQLEKFVDVQCAALEISNKKMPLKQWETATESFVCDLYLSKEEILDRESVQKAYHEIVSPLLTLARQMGF